MKKLRYFLAAVLCLLLTAYVLPVKKRTFADLYGQDDPVSRSLQAFRQLPTKTLDVAGRQWTYLSTGRGNRCLLFLHGMGGAYDIWWQQIDALQNDYRIISITLPEVHTAAEAVEGLLQILRQEGVDKLSIIGTSMGGYIAQYFLLTHPGMIDRLVLANTFPPNHILKEKNAGLRRWIPLLPEWYIMRGFRRNVSDVVVPASENSLLVKAYLHEQYSGQMRKGQFIGRMDVVLDYFEPSYDIRHLQAPVLIIESDNDPLITPDLQQALRRLYPEATVFTFFGKGHFPYLNDGEAYSGLLRKFLARS